jgi:hypothetical protein
MAASRSRSPTPPALPSSALGVPAPEAGVVPLQQNDPTAPAYLIRPRVSVSETFTDNVNYAHSLRIADAYTNILPGLSTRRGFKAWQRKTLMVTSRRVSRHSIRLSATFTPPGQPDTASLRP